MFNKKGQAALEFLSTYGWVLLMVLVAIGGMYQFGILDPTAFMSDECVSDVAFLCVDTQFKQSTQKVRFRNSIGEDIYIESASLVVKASGQSFNCNIPYSVIRDGTIFQATCYANLPYNKMERFDVIFKYYSAGSSASYSKPVYNTIRYRIQKD